MGIRATARLTDFSGYWILLVATVLVAVCLVFAPAIDPVALDHVRELQRLAGRKRLAGDIGAWLALRAGTALTRVYDYRLRCLGSRRGGDRSARQRMCRAGLFGRFSYQEWRAGSCWQWWCWLPRACRRPRPRAKGHSSAILNGVLPRPLDVALVAAIVLAQYLCGLATVTSASRMAYAFARDGGLPFSHAVRWVCPKRRSPAVAIWTVAAASVLFTLHTPVYATITAVCTIFLYVSYVLPCLLGAWAHGRSWTAMGPWNLGRWYRPLALFSARGLPWD